MGQSRSRRPRIGIVTRDDGAISGKVLSARRQGALISREYDVQTILFHRSDRAEDWVGRIERIDNEPNCTRVFTADLATEHTNRLELYTRAQLLVRLIREQEISALHCFGAHGKTGLVARYAAETAGIPYMLSFCGTDLTLETFADELAANRLAAEGAKVCTFNNEEARRLGTSLFAIRCPTFAIPNSFDWSEFSKPPAALSSHPHPVIGMCANLWRVAGTDHLLSAFEQLYPEVRTLLLIGEFWKQEASYFHQRLSSLACRDHIVVTGWVPHENIMGYIRSCDVLVFPSVADGSPKKVLEGLASGVPVIAAAVGGIRNMITDGVDGFLLPDPYPEAIVEKVRYVLKHQSHASECARRAQERISREFTREREHAQWRDCYRVFLG